MIRMAPLLLLPSLVACGGGDDRPAGPVCGPDADAMPAEPVVACEDDDAHEPNDFFLDAPDLDAGTDLVVCDASTDHFALEVGVDQRITIDAMFDGLLGDIDIDLLDACGDVIDSSAGTDDTESVSWANLYSEPQTVYLAVEIFGVGTNTYDFSSAVTDVE